MPYRNVLVGVDGSATSMRALADAARLAKMEGANLSAVYVRRDAGGRGDDVFVEARRVAEREGLELRTVEETGDPADRIVELATEEGVDLLVVGNKGMTGMKRFVLSGVPNAVSHQAPCDLLIVRTG